jgi:hypothetical protein
MRKLPPPDRKTVCAPADVPILEYYKNHFDCVFVNLHPFTKIKQNAKMKYQDWFEGEYPTKTEEIENLELVKWKEISNLTGLSTIEEIDIALRTSIMGLRKDLENQASSEKLHRIIRENNILPPTEGVFEAIQENSILEGIKNLGYKWICLGGEFGDSMQLVWLEDLIDDKVKINQKNLYTYDKKILVTVHWDSFQTYICSSHEFVNKIVEFAKLEGFYCNSKTEIYWSVENKN